jgi:hypothetical protein
LVFGLQWMVTGRAVVATVNLRERSEINHAVFSTPAGESNSSIILSIINLLARSAAAA